MNINVVSCVTPYSFVYVQHRFDFAWFLGSHKGEKQFIRISSVYCSQIRAGFQFVRAGMDAPTRGQCFSKPRLSRKRKRKRFCFVPPSTVRLFSSGRS
jgi:hypothetical protein